MADAHINFGYGVIATAPSPATSGTTATLTTGDEILNGTPPFNATIWPTASQPLKSNSEIVRITAINTGTRVITFTRTQESTTARTVVVGDQISATITNKTLTDIENTISPLTNNAGNLGINTVTANEKLTLNGNFQVKDADTATKAYRFRTSGSNLDFDFAGSGLYLSGYPNADFTGTQQFYLGIDTSGNVNAFGVWRYQTAPFGTTKITIDTAAVAPLAVVGNISATGNITTGYVAKTAAYTIGATDSIINCTANRFTVTLPTAVGITGRQYIIKNSGTSTITVATTSSQTIDGATTYILQVQYMSVTVVSDGANWIII